MCSPVRSDIRTQRRGVARPGPTLVTSTSVPPPASTYRRSSASARARVVEQAVAAVLPGQVEEDVLVRQGHAQLARPPPGRGTVITLAHGAILSRRRLQQSAVTATAAEVRIPMSDGVALAATLYLPDTDDAAAVPAGGAALSQGRPHLVLRAVLRAAARRARVRRVPARPARHRLVGGRRARRVPARRAARPRRGDRLAGRPRPGATARSACGARRTPASTPCRWPASGRRR